MIANSYDIMLYGQDWRVDEKPARFDFGVQVVVTRTLDLVGLDRSN